MPVNSISVQQVIPMSKFRLGDKVMHTIANEQRSVSFIGLVVCRLWTDYGEESYWEYGIDNLQTLENGIFKDTRVGEDFVPESKLSFVHT